MTEERTKRKLTAIFSADVAGYSRLMGDDEVGTVQLLKEYREIMANFIQKHRGRVVDSPGDNILAEFGSIVDATECAVKIQEKLQTKNAELSEDKRLEFRIGINHGDVLEDEDRIYGDGVNIAARIEGLAPPGGICISRTTYDQIKNRLNLGYEYLGDHSVKNISEPVRVYRILTEPEAIGKVIGEKMFLGKISRRVAISAIIILIVVAGGLAAWNFYLHQSKRVEPASLDKMAFPLPDDPSIAVLPFDNMSGDPKQDYFSDGLSDHIITNLSKVPHLFVIARNSTFTYKGKPVKVQKVAENLGVRYVLEGSVQKTADRIRVTAQLIDAIKGHHLWAESYDQDLKDIFAVQDEITKKIITAMQVKLTEGQEVKAASKGTKNLEAYLKYLQASELINKVNPESNALAKQLAEEAVDLDPAYAWAYYILGRSHMMDVWVKTSKSPQKSIGKAIELVQKAIALDDTNAEAHALLGFLYSMTRQYDKAVGQAEKAVAVNPNSAYGHFGLGKTLFFAGRVEESIPEYKKAIRLNPIPPSKDLWSLGLSYAYLEQYDEAIKWCEKAVHKEPNDLLGRVMMTVVYSMSGRDKEAQSEAAEVLRIQPKFTIGKFKKKVTYKNKSDAEKFFGALRKAEIPE